jgi:hypothetical protein
MTLLRLRSVVLVTAAMMFAMPLRAAQVMMLGVGSTASCGTWLYRRRSGDFFDMGNWALGYVSGAAIFGDVGNPLGRTDSNGVLYWLDNYCASHPTEDLTGALNTFIVTYGR